jgi:hypothetical protein
MSARSEQCPAGYYGSVAGLADSTCSGLCPAGYYCPAGSVNPREKGCGSAEFFCPEGSVLPLRVFEGYYSIGGIKSQRVRYLNSTHNATVFENATAQRICEAGQYCTLGVKYVCPAGSYGNRTGIVGEAFKFPVRYNVSVERSSSPTWTPSKSPYRTASPSTKKPTRSPTVKTVAPTRAPSLRPTNTRSPFSVTPTSQPTSVPSRQPSQQPSRQPSSQPSRSPTRQPTRQPTCQPIMRPTDQPSSSPSLQPTSKPTFSTSHISRLPSSRPSALPSFYVLVTSQPTRAPTLFSQYKIPFICSGMLAQLSMPPVYIY